MSSKEKAAHESISKTEEDKTGKYRILSSDMLAMFEKYKKSRVCRIILSGNPSLQGNISMLRASGPGAM